MLERKPFFTHRTDLVKPGYLPEIHVLYNCGKYFISRSTLKMHLTHTKTSHSVNKQFDVELQIKTLKPSSLTFTTISLYVPVSRQPFFFFKKTTGEVNNTSLQ